jgi:hypothetical protein
MTRINYTNLLLTFQACNGYSLICVPLYDTLGKEETAK